MISVCLALVLTGVACSAEGLSENEVRNMKIIAHRGGSSLGNENTLSCIAAGMAAGAASLLFLGAAGCETRGGALS